MQIWPARDARIFAFCIQTGNGGGAGGDVAAGGTAGSDDSIWVNAELCCVLSQPADGAFGILHAYLGRCLMSRPHAVVSAGGYHAARGQVMGLSGELFDCAAGPPAAEKENDSRTFVLGSPIFGKMNVDGQFALRRLLLDVPFDTCVVVLVVGIQQLLIASTASSTAILAVAPRAGSPCHCIERSSRQ